MLGLKNGNGSHGYVFRYKGIIIYGYSELGNRIGKTTSAIQYWLTKTEKENYFICNGEKIEIIAKGNFRVNKKDKFYGKNKVKTRIVVLQNLELTYSTISGKLIKTKHL